MSVPSICLLFLLLVACSTNVQGQSDTTIYFHDLKKLSIAGDFDGDGQTDTLFQHTFSRRYQREIEQSADPFQTDWDVVQTWFYAQDADVYLTTSKNHPDTLHLGTAQGLYCLLNLGDVNEDGRDEIALVVDRLDFSRVNACYIYTLCRRGWTELFTFGVHEDAFNFADKPPVFTEIKEYLEKQEGRWRYKDYLQEGWDTLKEVGQMKRLFLDRCE